MVVVIPTKEVFECIDSSAERATQMLVRLASQPSVAATGEGIDECSKLVRGLLEELGARPNVYDLGEGSPVVAGEIKSRKNPRKTILFYNHYDVQPPEPLEFWETPPFQPTIKEGRMYGRGVADDKAELTGRLNLTKAFLEARGDLPCNFKFLFEGEEEIGSVHLHEYLKKFPEIFRADSVIWEFGGVDPKDRPNVVLCEGNPLRGAHSEAREEGRTFLAWRDCGQPRMEIGRGAEHDQAEGQDPDSRLV